MMRRVAVCEFCDIVRGVNGTTEVVYRDNHTVAFSPKDPATPGHTLVVPTRHVPDIWSLDGTTVDRLAESTIRVARAVKAATGAEGLSVIQSNGAAASQTVPHLHVHVVPRWRDDPMGRIWPESRRYSDRDQYEGRLKVKAALAALATSQQRDPQISEEDRRQHLGFIQAVVTRMAGASAGAKAWLLPVVTAAYGYAIAQSDRGIALLGMASVLVFGILDANYLRQERAYRSLYDTVAQDRRQVPKFTLDPSHAGDPLIGESNPAKRVVGWAGRWLPAPQIWFSWSTAPFYGGLLIVGIAIVVVGWP